MKLLTTTGLTKLIEIIKSSFISTSDVEETSEISIDTTVTEDSENLITSGAVYDGLASKQNVTDNTLTTTSKNIVGAINELAESYIKETYKNGTSGYILYSNDLCIQWGVAPAGGNGSSITLLKTYEDANYLVLTNGANGGAGSFAIGNSIETKSYDRFYYHTWNRDGVGAFAPFNWMTVGYYKEYTSGGEMF